MPKFPFRISRSLRIRSFAQANIIAIACSATERVFAPGAMTTGIPSSVAAATSTSSTPTPGRPIALRFGHCSIVTRSIEPMRMMTPSASLRCGSMSFGSPESVMTMSAPASSSTFIPASCRRCEMTIFAFFSIVLPHQ